MELDAFHHQVPATLAMYDGRGGAGSLRRPAPPPRSSLHASRHFLGCAPACLRSLPFAPPGSAPGGEGLLAHRLLAMGAWKQDAEQHRLSVFDLAVALAPDGSVSSASPEELTSWVPPGRVTALATASLGSAPPAATGGGPRTAAVLLATTATGALCRLRLALPRTPGAGPGDVDLLGLGTDCSGTDLLPWLWPGGEGGAGGGEGAAALTAVDTASAASGGASTSASIAAVAGADGALHLVNLGAEGEASASLVTRLAPPRPGVSLSAVRFIGRAPPTLLAAGTAGLELWDGRAGASSSSSSSRPACRVGSADGGAGLWPFPSGRPTCLATHPARPHLAAAAGPGGVVAFWDLRGGGASLKGGPLATTAAPSGADVWDVAFDDHAPGGPAALFVSEAGELGCARLAEGGGGGGGGGVGSAATASTTILYQEPAGAAVALDAAGPDACVATDQECLVYVRRGGL